ncbi:MAG: DUF4826 domain-containing protein [Gammaproteobacteria bacterium]|nr:MAG: DUF4826 domain-containing protein [Gammaproteobacteria bacterium]
MSEEIQQESPDPQMTEQQWIQKEAGAVLGYCSSKGLQVTDFINDKSAILPPFVAVWLVLSKQTNEKYWVISGDLPIDHIPFKIAKAPREALRHFSLGWQLKADRLLASIEEAQPQLNDAGKQTEFADLLISRAEMLAELIQNDEMWHKQ